MYILINSFYEAIVPSFHKLLRCSRGEGWRECICKARVGTLSYSRVVEELQHEYVLVLVDVIARTRRARGSEGREVGRSFSSTLTDLLVAVYAKLDAWGVGELYDFRKQRSVS